MLVRFSLGLVVRVVHCCSVLWLGVVFRVDVVVGLCLIAVCLLLLDVYCWCLI